jgi:RNA polymerase sigma-B factor
MTVTPTLTLPSDVSVERSDADQDLDLLRALRAAETTDDQAECERLRDVLVRRHTGLVRWLASRYQGRGVPSEELVQVGFLGLMLAVTRFDPDHGSDFRAFAKPTVQGEIRRYFRDKRRWIQIPRRVQEAKAVVAAATDELTQSLGRSPTVAELATHLGVDQELVLEALTVEDNFSLASLDTPLADGDESATLADTVGADDTGYELIENCHSLKPLIAGLPERDRLILSLRFVDELTQSEIGAHLGVSQMHVSRLLSRALRTLREQMLVD